MKKRLCCVILIVLFMMGCILPALCIPFSKNEISENRTLSELPSFINEDGELNSLYFDELTTFVAEHFAGRSKLIEIDSELKFDLLNTPSDDQVIIGKDGWFYFDQTLNDYAGVTLSEDEINQIADNLSKVEEFILAKNKTPIIMIVPNKNTVYDEFMPSRFDKKASVTNLSLLQQALTNKSVNYYNVNQILQEGKANDTLYLLKDTHWNNTGARLALNGLYEALNIDFSYDLKNYTIEKNHKSDLSEILFPTKDNLEEQRIYEEISEYDYVKRIRSLDDLNIQTTNESGNGKSILMYRDSFGRAVIPYMAQVFDNCTFNRSTPYDLSVIDSCECDYVVIEIVERNLKDLGDIDCSPLESMAERADDDGKNF